MKLRIAKWIYKNLGGDAEHKDHCVPGDWLHFEFGEPEDGEKPYVAMTLNDGYEVWLCYNYPGAKWAIWYRAEHARALAKFILWDWWGKATWFGLKRRLWYWALSTKLSQHEWHRKRIRGR